MQAFGHSFVIQQEKRTALKLFVHHPMFRLEFLTEKLQFQQTINESLWFSINTAMFCPQRIIELENRIEINQTNE